jgi:hypothetical protein
LLYLAFPFETQTDEGDKGAAVTENNDFSSVHVSGFESAGGDEKDPESLHGTIPVVQSLGINDADRKSHRFLDIVKSIEYFTNRRDIIVYV